MKSINQGPFPEQIIEQEMFARQWSNKKLAKKMGCPVKEVKRILQGEQPITRKIAGQLAKAFGTSRERWMNLDKVGPALVIWHDTALYPDWYGSQDELPDATIRLETLGWLMRQTEELVVLAMTMGEFKINTIKVIPMACVESLYVLPSPDRDSDETS